MLPKVSLTCFTQGIFMKFELKYNFLWFEGRTMFCSLANSVCLLLYANEMQTEILSDLETEKTPQAFCMHNFYRMDSKLENLV